jgi:hypothetical protein
MIKGIEQAFVQNTFGKYKFYYLMRLILKADTHHCNIISLNIISFRPCCRELITPSRSFDSILSDLVMP